MRNTLRIQDAYPAGKIHGSGDPRGAVGVILLDLIPGDPLENWGFLNPTILDSAAFKILVPTGQHFHPKTQTESYDITSCTCAEGPAGRKSSHHPCRVTDPDHWEEVRLLLHRRGRGMCRAARGWTWEFLASPCPVMVVKGQMP